ncbi:lectin-like domain-containing protein [Lactococcus allomyrinae]|uniref:MucBP domain-containing protein n=1 Tax=Lactococcus allomyrinae TaxID=2419773 RepID=A0A387BN35_9LACT|nr:MucBP domain-containing protein [Lactococcus allomyrinae]AYF99930.1 hypothetical protein D7I46_01800 [Lactococcus allomyrinae]
MNTRQGNKKTKRIVTKVLTFLSAVTLLSTPLFSTISGVQNIFGLIDAKAAIIGPTVTVQPKDFENYFTQTGSAKYSYTTGAGYGTLTLTPNSTNQVGMAAMNVKFDMSQDWKITGNLNIGNKGGADGVSFGWYPGDTGVVGIKGADLGIGGLRGAFGWTADTYKNSYTIPTILPSTATGADPVYTLTNSGIVGGDPSSTNSTWAVGGWSYANPNPMYDVKNSYPSGGGAPAIAPKTAYNKSDNPQKDISSLADGKFHAYSLTYTASTGTITVVFGSLTWQMPISSLESLAGDESSSALSFFISGSTGGVTNLQQFQFTSATFTEALGTVTANYVDASGNTLASSVSTQGIVGKDGYTTSPKTITGYSLKNVEVSDSTATNSANTITGLYTANDITVNYVYAPNPETATITYIDTDTNQQVGAVDTTTGVFNGSSNYTVKIPSGYILSPHQNPNDEFTPANASKKVFNQDGVTQNFNVYLIKQHSIVTDNFFESDATIHYVDMTKNPLPWMSSTPYSNQSNPTGNPTQSNGNLVGAGNDYIYRVWMVGVTTYQPGDATPNVIWYSSTSFVPTLDANGNPKTPAVSDVLDSNGNPINGWTQQSSYNPGLVYYPIVPGYTWQKTTQLINGNEIAAGDNEFNGGINGTINITAPQQNGAPNPQHSVYYVYYNSNYSFSNRTTKEVNETINYLDVNSRMPIATKYTTSQSLTVETVTDSSGKQTVYYYKGNGTPESDNHPFAKDGTANPDWADMTSFNSSFGTQVNPEITNYTVVGADGNLAASSPYLSDDKTQVTPQVVNDKFDDIVVNVYYAYDGQDIHLPFTGGIGWSQILVIALFSAIVAYLIQWGKRIKNKK